MKKPIIKTLDAPGYVVDASFCIGCEHENNVPLIALIENEGGVTKDKH